MERFLIGSIFRRYIENFWYDRGPVHYESSKGLCQELQHVKRKLVTTDLRECWLSLRGIIHFTRLWQAGEELHPPCLGANITSYATARTTGISNMSLNLGNILSPTISSTSFRTLFCSGLGNKWIGILTKYQSLSLREPKYRDTAYISYITSLSTKAPAKSNRTALLSEKTQPHQNLTFFAPTPTLLLLYLVNT